MEWERMPMKSKPSDILNLASDIITIAREMTTWLLYKKAMFYHTLCLRFRYNRKIESKNNIFLRLISNLCMKTCDSLSKRDGSDDIIFDAIRLKSFYTALNDIDISRIDKLKGTMLRVIDYDYIITLCHHDELIVDDEDCISGDSIVVKDAYLLGSYGREAHFDWEYVNGFYGKIRKDDMLVLRKKGVKIEDTGRNTDEIIESIKEYEQSLFLDHLLAAPYYRTTDYHYSVYSLRDSQYMHVRYP